MPLFLFGAFGIGGAAEIHFPAVGELDVSRAGAERAILRLEGGVFDLCSGGERIPVPPLAQQYGGRSAFNAPPVYCAVWLWHVDYLPGMRIDPFHLDDFALKLDLLGLVEFCGKRMMRCQ